VKANRCYPRSTLLDDPRANQSASTSASEPNASCHANLVSLVEGRRHVAMAKLEGSNRSTNEGCKKRCIIVHRPERYEKMMMTAEVVLFVVTTPTLNNDETSLEINMVPHRTTTLLLLRLFSRIAANKPTARCTYRGSNQYGQDKHTHGHFGWWFGLTNKTLLIGFCHWDSWAILYFVERINNKDHLAVFYSVHSMHFTIVQGGGCVCVCV
jgi:hypothetical protein